MEKNALIIVGNNTPFFAKDNHETEIPVRWENAVDR